MLHAIQRSDLIFKTTLGASLDSSNVRLNSKLFHLFTRQIPFLNHHFSANELTHFIRPITRDPTW